MMNHVGLGLLKWLQEWRSPGIESFFMEVTRAGEGFWILVVAGALFWIWGARVAYRVGFALAVGNLLTDVLKIVFNVPRPWMRDPTIVPVAGSVWGAPGYSFPSGHTANIALLWGGIADAVRRVWGWVLALVCIALVAFSRLVLGVHSPVDVVGSLLLAGLVVWGMGRVYDWTERNPSKHVWVLAGAAILSLIAWGVLRLNAAAAAANPSAAQAVMRSIWGVMGFFAAWFVERKYIRFEPARLGWFRVLAVPVGLLVLSLMVDHLPKLLAPLVGAEVGSYVLAAANPFWIFVVWPLLLRGLEKKV